MPPDRPSTIRRKPAWRSCSWMKPTMMRRATPVSMASSRGSSKAASESDELGAGSAEVIARPLSAARPGHGSYVQARLGIGVRRGVGRLPGSLANDPLQLPQHQLGTLVAQQGQADPLAAKVAQLDVDE